MDEDRHIRRLIEASADPYDAFDDVDWAAPFDPSDPRLGLFAFDPLAATGWYRAQPAPRRAEVGLARTASVLRTGWEFENLLQQGLLHHAWRMSNTDATFSYVHIEVMEESQHTLMFHEFVRRHAPHVRGMGRLLRTVADPAVLLTARAAPALFYFMVLGGEVPVDHYQRLAVKAGTGHPLVERIMQIHVEEEARHVAFANGEIRRIVPTLSRAERAALAVAVPTVLAIMVPLMLHPSPWLVDRYAIPRRDLRRALTGPDARQLRVDSVARIWTLAKAVGLTGPPAAALWRHHHLR